MRHGTSMAKALAPEETRRLCVQLVTAHGQRAAAKRLGISRTLLLTVLARQPVLPGSLHLLAYGVLRATDKVLKKEI